MGLCNGSSLLVGRQGHLARVVGAVGVVFFVMAHAAVASAAAQTLLTTNRQAMEGDLKVPQGSTLQVGYGFTMPGGHPGATVGFSETTVTFNATCASGTPGAATVVVSIPDAAYTDPAGSSGWYPTGDERSSASYEGAATVPSFCDPGALVRLQQGGTFSTAVTSTDTTDPVNVRWHYRENTAGSWSGTYSVIPGVPTTTQLGPTASLTVGQQVSLAVSVGPVPSGGTVTFTADGSPVAGCSALAANGSGQATCVTTFNTAGTYSIVAVYSGDAAFGPSTSGAETLTVSDDAIIFAT